MTTDELRRAVEGLEQSAYETWGYYDRWNAAIASLLLERGAISEADIATELGEFEDAPQQIFKRGDRVQVKSEDERLRWRRPHLRTPGYVFCKIGVVERVIGEFADPFLLAFRTQTGPKTTLYSVAFKQRDLFAACPFDDPEAAGADDEVTVEIYGGWLAPTAAEPAPGAAQEQIRTRTPLCHRRREHNEHHHQHHQHDHGHDHDHHDHDHDHNPKPDHDRDHDHGHGDEGHAHQGRLEVETRAVQGEPAPSPGQVVGECLVRILCAKGLVTSEELNSTASALESLGTELLGARLVARAWVDPEFKTLLLDDAAAAGKLLGISTSNPNAPTVLIVVENTPKVWNLVVCTLCSCYPSSLLGIAPTWYKSSTYRARAVIEPRKVLSVFGTNIGPDVVVRVHDSTADTRYMVLPEKPADTDGWSEQALFETVTRDALVGVARLPEVAV